MSKILELDTILSQWAENVIAKIQLNLESTGTNASGRTSASLDYEITDTGLIISGRQYFQGVEQGRPGGRVPYRFQDVIRQWMEDKGIANQFGSTESAKRSAAYLIAKFIDEHGTKLYREGGRDDIFTSVFEEELPKLEEEVAIEVNRIVLTELDKVAK